MKKPYKIEVDKSVPRDIAKILKRLLRPVLSVGRPGKCLLCGTETTWTINDRPVCPADHVKYGFLNECYVPDSCEVCGCQGEWCTAGEPIHSLCFKHRDAWFHWAKHELCGISLPNELDKWHEAWNKCWASFVKHYKGIADEG